MLKRTGAADVVRGPIAVGKRYRIAASNGNGLGLKLKVLLIDLGFGRRRRFGHVESLPPESDDSLGQFA
jgi:hypothetical protein